MSELSEVLGALMISLVHARRLADEETAAVAEYYKDNPLLEGMSLPRVRVPELTIDMPVTFEQYVPAKDAELDTTANIHKALMEQFRQSLDDEDREGVADDREGDAAEPYPQQSQEEVFLGRHGVGRGRVQHAPHGGQQVR